MTYSNGETAFSVHGMTKTYPDFSLGPIDLELEPDSVMAFIGPNGSGKTTTLNCLVGLCERDAGDVTIFGRANRPDRVDWKHDVGYVGEHIGLYRNWSAARNLAFLERFYAGWDASRVQRLADRFDLPLNRKVGELSRGNRAKLALVAALGHSPRLLLLDEPFAGLDPVVRAEVLDVLWECLEGGNTAIMYSTHILSDISRLADDLVFLAEGRVQLRTPKDHLTDRWRRISFRARSRPEEIPCCFEHRNEGTQHRLISWDHERSLRAIRQAEAEEVQLSLMSVDEIAVEIMKGRSDVEFAGN